MPPIFQILGLVVCFGAPAAIAFVVSGWLWSWRRPLASLAVAASAPVACYIILFLFASRSAAIVRIETPQDADVVKGGWLSVEGDVKPADASVTILVHPTEANGWWVQAPVQKGIGGAWRAGVSLGTSTDGRHKHFQLVAVAASSPWLAALRGQLLREGVRVVRPPALPQSEIVSIWRVE
jgi:hypothetical protein